MSLNIDSQECKLTYSAIALLYRLRDNLIII